MGISAFTNHLPERELSPLFDEMYAADGQGRASVPRERLLKASLYSVGSERAFCEEFTYHLLFRWFLDMDMLESFAA